MSVFEWGSVNGSYVDDLLWMVFTMNLTVPIFHWDNEFSQVKSLELMRKSVHSMFMKMVFESLSICFCVSNRFEKSRFQSLFELVDRICSLFWKLVWYQLVTWWCIIWATFMSSCLLSRLRSSICVFVSPSVSSVIIWYQPIQLSIHFRIWIVSWLKPREYGWA